jgi:hypothetical protein
MPNSDAKRLNISSPTSYANGQSGMKMNHKCFISTNGKNNLNDRLYLLSNLLSLFTFVGAFAKPRNTTIRFVMSVCPYIKQFGCHWTSFYEILYLNIFQKSVDKIQVSLKSDKNNGYLTWRPIHILDPSRAVLLRIRNVSDRSHRENQNTVCVR